MNICIDGRLAQMSGGTGVSVYGAALAESVGLLGHVVEGLVEGRRRTRFDAWRGALRPGAWPVPLVDRAVARLGASADYAGESWEVPAAELGGRGSATVAIRVEPVADRPTRRRVRVQADYPAGSERRVRQSRESIVAVQPPNR